VTGTPTPTSARSFIKLGIRSRRELHDALRDEPSAIASA
jgi:hypothetical protein